MATSDMKEIIAPYNQYISYLIEIGSIYRNTGHKHAQRHHPS